MENAQGSATYLFDDATRKAAATRFDTIITSNAAESKAWNETVPLYWPDGAAEPDKARKAELAALYKTQYFAKYPDASDNTPKVMFSRGCARAEYAIGRRKMPENKGGKGTKKTATATQQTQTTTSSTADVGNAAFTLEVAAMVREVADRMHTMQGNMNAFVTSQKLTKAATLAFTDLLGESGKIAELIGAVNVKLGNVPAAQ